MYSDLYFKNKRKVSLFLVLFTTISVLSVALYILRTTAVNLRASNIGVTTHEIVNVSPHQAGIFWQTTEAGQGWVLYGKDQNSINEIALDSRDIASNKVSVKNHYVYISGLEQDTTYYYRIIQDNNILSHGSNEVFSFKTMKSGNTLTSLAPAFGRIMNKSSNPVNDVFVFIRYPEAISLMAISKPTGEWLIPLQYVADRNNLGYIPLSNESEVLVEMLHEEEESSTINALIGNITPLVNVVTLGEDYTYLEVSNVLPAYDENKPQGGMHTISIIFPREAAVIPGNRPLIKGLGIPGNTVTVTIQSASGFIYRVPVNKTGEWNVELAQPLLPGEYKMTIQTPDKSGNVKTLSRSFIIAKSGEQVLSESTPGGVLTSTPTTTPDPTNDPQDLTPTLPQTVITNTPILTPTPEVTGNVDPNLTPTITVIPDLGFDFNTVAISSIVFLLIAAGLVFVF